jgi:glycosyltransferase involved in cell wall biosynthesis
MPSHDATAFIDRGIASVLLQSLSDLELIVVDDCSTDDTVAKVEDLASRDPRVRLILRRTNGGPAETRNEGVAAAKGRYVAFLDADDVWHPEKLELQIAAMNEVGALLSYTDFRTINVTSGVTRIRTAPATVSYDMLLRNNVIGCSTAIYDAATLGKRYFPRIRRRQDFGLWLDILRDIPLAHRCGGVLTDYTLRPGSVSSNKITSAMFTWRLFREIERLPLHKAVYYFTQYAISGFTKTAGLESTSIHACVQGTSPDARAMGLP